MLLTNSEVNSITNLFEGKRYKIAREKNIVELCHDNWLGVHLDSIWGGLTIPLSPFLITFLNYFHILPTQISPNDHQILAYFPRICTCHVVEPTMALFCYIFMFQVN